MRDVRDWNKYVDLVGKSVSKRTAASLSVESQADRPREEKSDREAVAPLRSPSDDTTRKGRGPRRQETREELLSRLLDPTLTLEETACILEVCPTTVRRYTNKGILPHERSQGNQRRFKLSSVIAFREAQARSGQETAAE